MKGVIMDKPNDYNYSPYNQFYPGYEDDGMFNPMSGYEQGYMYYSFLCKQMEYKIKCKEFERICNTTFSKNERRVE